MLATPRRRLGAGCVTVNRCQPDAAGKWEDLRAMINTTKKEKLEFTKGPYFWNPTGEINKYGTLTIK